MSQVTRRDFLNGVALTIAAGLTPMAQLNAQQLAAQMSAQPGRYPPALTGMRASSSSTITTISAAMPSATSSTSTAA